jgi:hypothetical protein
VPRWRVERPDAISQVARAGRVRVRDFGRGAFRRLADDVHRLSANLRRHVRQVAHQLVDAIKLDAAAHGVSTSSQ